MWCGCQACPFFHFYLVFHRPSSLCSQSIRNDIENGWPPIHVITSYAPMASKHIGTPNLVEVCARLAFVELSAKWRRYVFGHQRGPLAKSLIVLLSNAHNGTNKPKCEYYIHAYVCDANLLFRVTSVLRRSDGRRTRRETPTSCRSTYVQRLAKFLTLPMGLLPPFR